MTHVPARDPRRLDVTIIGAGPNGLTCAAYLARAGASVAVVEKRFEWGGTLASDDYSTPFLYNLCQFVLPLGQRLPPYRDLALADDGVRFIEPELIARITSGAAEVVVDRTGRGLCDGLDAMIEEAESFLTPLLYATPQPEARVRAELHSGGAEHLLEWAELTPGQIRDRCRTDLKGALLRYLAALAGCLDENRPLGLTGAYQLSRVFRGSIVVGGSKALANALFRSAITDGAEVLTLSDAVGVEEQGPDLATVLKDGRRLVSRAVVSTLDPVTSLLNLPAPPLVPAPALAEARIAGLTTSWGTPSIGPFTAHFGVKADLTGSRPPALFEIVGFAGVDDVEAHLREAASGEVPTKVGGHLTVTTLHDPRQASSGPFGPLHTLRFQTLVPLEPSTGWDPIRSAYRSRLYEAVATALHLDADPLFQFADTPHDIDRRFRTRGGWPSKGELTAGLQDHPHRDGSASRTPIHGYYLGGNGVHPGVAGSLAGGYLAASAVCADLGLKRWWPTPEVEASGR